MHRVIAEVSAEQQLAELERGVVDLVSREDLLARLKGSIDKGKPLRIKAGFDPTRPDLHLGHAVLMAKMRQFQQLGHEVVFVVGDFTASIGDPSGKSKTRPALSREEIDAGAKSYAEQAFKILDRGKTRIEHNDTWLGPMKFADVVRLAGKYTLARMMERQDFKARWERGDAISIHELLYPLAQAQDSVHLVADVELGGTDQLFNLMVGRDLMKENGQRPQVVMTTCARWPFSFIRSRPTIKLKSWSVPPSSTSATRCTESCACASGYRSSWMLIASPLS